MQEYTYRPAPLKPARTWHLQHDGIRSADGESLKFTELTGIRYTDFAWNRQRLRRLDLEAGERTLEITHSGEPGAGSANPDMAVFFDLLRNLLNAVEATRPDLPIAIGENRRARLRLFWLGVAGLTMGVGLGIAALLTTAAHKAAAASVPFGLLTLIGGFTAWGNRPGRSLPTLAINQFLDLWLPDR